MIIELKQGFSIWEVLVESNSWTPSSYCFLVVAESAASAQKEVEESLAGVAYRILGIRYSPSSCADALANCWPGCGSGQEWTQPSTPE